MSNVEAKRAERDRQLGEQGHLAHAFGPTELAAVMAAQAHGTFIWLTVLAGLSGFRTEYLPAVGAAWVAACTQWAGLATSVWTASPLNALKQKMLKAETSS